MGYCHKCKYEVSAECVPRSQKMGFPNCYQSIITRADLVRAMTDEELAYEISEKIDCCVCKSMHNTEEDECPCRPHQACVDFWLAWLRQTSNGCLRRDRRNAASISVARNMSSSMQSQRITGL